MQHLIFYEGGGTDAQRVYGQYRESNDGISEQPLEKR